MPNIYIQSNNCYEISYPPSPVEASSISLLPKLDVSSPPPIELEAVSTPLPTKLEASKSPPIEPKASIPLPERKIYQRAGGICPSS